MAYEGVLRPERRQTVRELRLEINLLKKGIGKSPTTLRFSNIPIGKKMSMHQEENTMDIKFSKYFLKH